MNLLHISDPHFGTEQAPVAEALAALVHAQRPDALILSGDITQRATAAQFAAARRFVDRLGIGHRLVLPGNHDIPLLNLWQRFARPYARYLAAFGPALESELETPELLAIGVNTTRRWRHTDGEVSATQVERVAQRLQRASPGQLRIVVTHQPIHVFRPRDEHNLLHGHAFAARAWAAAGADLVLGGHIHLPYVRPVSERYPELPRTLWCVQAGTAVSSRIRREAANSVNLIRYEPQPQACSVERWDYIATAASFDLVERTVTALDRAGRAAGETR